MCVFLLLFRGCFSAVGAPLWLAATERVDSARTNKGRATAFTRVCFWLWVLYCCRCLRERVFILLRVRGAVRVLLQVQCTRALFCVAVSVGRLFAEGLLLFLLSSTFKELLKGSLKGLLNRFYQGSRAV